MWGIFVLPKILDKKKNEGEAYFCLMYQLVTKKIPDKKKNEGAAFFLLTKNPGKKWRRGIFSAKCTT